MIYVFKNLYFLKRSTKRRRKHYENTQTLKTIKFTVCKKHNRHGAILKGRNGYYIDWDNNDGLIT